MQEIKIQHDKEADVAIGKSIYCRLMGRYWIEWAEFVVPLPKNR